jgi:hypothetical protein
MHYSNGSHQVAVFLYLGNVCCCGRLAVSDSSVEPATQAGHFMQLLRARQI